MIRFATCSRPAFTLLELLLALAISLIIVAALGASLYTAFHARANIQQALDDTRSSDLAGDTLSKELANALPPTPNASANANIFSTGAFATGGVLIGPFEGSATNVDFCTSGPEPRANLQPDVREVEYLLVGDTQSNYQMLVRRVNTNLLSPQTTTPPDQVICHNVTNFTLSYYDGTTWNDTWDSTQQSNALPVAVQFILELSPRNPGEPTRQDTRMIPLSCAVASAAGGG